MCEENSHGLSVGSIASGVIVFRREDPSEIFIEVKDDGHPTKLVRRQLCVIGGNWVGEAAKYDRNPLATCRREFKEEISFERPIRDGVELKLLGMSSKEEKFAPSPIEMKPREDEVKQLEELKEVICASCCPFGDYNLVVRKAALDKADPDNKKPDMSGIFVYFVVSLAEIHWQMLKRLQDKFNNLSCESTTIITSLSDIIAANTKTAFGHDRVLQRFFLAMGLAEAKYLPLQAHHEARFIGTTLPSYDDYLAKFSVMKKP